MRSPTTALACGVAMMYLLLSICQAAPADVFVPPEPLRIGVGGDWGDGLDGMLAERGLPYERIFAWELSDPEVLKRFDLILLSCPAPLQAGFDEALDAWIKAGGRAYIETSRYGSRPPLMPTYVSTLGLAPDPSDVVIVDPAFVTARGVEAGAPIDLYDMTSMLLQAHEGSDSRVIAQYCPDKGGEPLQGAAVLSLTLGEGEVILAGSPLAFCCFRGEATRPILYAIIDHFLRGLGQPRLTSVAPEPQESAPGAKARDSAPAPVAGTPPDGFEPVDAMAAAPYNVTATLGPASGPRGPASMLVLDGQPSPSGKMTRPCVWVAFGAKNVEIRAGTKENSAALARAAWQPPTEPVELLVRRRLGLVSIVLGEEEVLRAPVEVDFGGLVAAKTGLVPLVDPYCQEVAEPVLFDDFMREPDDPTEWTNVGGQWTSVGVGDEKHSINGFFLRGESSETGVTAIGNWFWDDYAVSVAAHPESATACGLAALRQENGDLIAFVADVAPKTWPTLRLVRVTDGRETVLAERTGCLTSGQWYRLALRASNGKLEALVDGEVRVACANPEVRGGGIGLIVKGGATRFDDVVVQPAAEPLRSPRGEGTPAPDVPPYIGAEDHITWANPAAPWLASAARPSLLWHQGDFPGDVSVSLALTPEAEPAFRRLILAPSNTSDDSVWLSVTVRTAPETAAASLEVTRAGEKTVEKEAALGGGQTLRLARAADVVRVLWGDDVIYETPSEGALRRVALEVDGPPVPIQSLQVASPGNSGYAFGAAPTDWWSSSGTWEVAARWACDSRWSFFAGWGEDDAAVWSKRPVEGDVTVDYYVGVKMDAPGGSEVERCRDLNTVLCGNRGNARSGYSFILGGEGGVKTQLLREGVVVAESDSIRVPPGFGVHQEWFHIRAARIGNRVELDLEGRPVFRWEDPDPLPGGYVGLWTHNSGVLISRVDIYR